MIPDHYVVRQSFLDTQAHSPLYSSHQKARFYHFDSERVCTYEDVLRCKMKNCEYWPKGGKAEPVGVGDTVLIWGDYYGAVDAAVS